MVLEIVQQYLGLRIARADVAIQCGKAGRNAAAEHGARAMRPTGC